jgi:GDSL-like Lipase/Acylhydrolase
MSKVTPRSRSFLVSLAVFALVLIAALPALPQNGYLSPLVVVGDSLSAGYQNGSLLGSQQVDGYANLVAQQMHAQLNLPLIKFPGVPNVLQLTGPSLFDIAPAPGSIDGNPRVDPLLQATDLAVPGATVSDVLNKVPFAATTDDYAMTNLVLGFPGVLATPPVTMTQVQWAQALKPARLILWIGANDALGAATNGQDNVTPVWQFAQSYSKLVDDLSQTHAKLVIANIPDVTSVPFFVSVPKLAALFKLPKLVVMAKLRLGPGDYVVLDSVAKAAAILQAGSGQLSDTDVLTAREAAKVSIAIDAYNLIIAWHARRVGATLVDIHELFREVGRHGYWVNGRLLTTDFLGGVFSLDGIHPTNTGYAIVANEFIKDMNRSYGWGIPMVSVTQVAASDPLVLPSATPTPKVLKQDALNGMRKMFRH